MKAVEYKKKSDFESESDCYLCNHAEVCKVLAFIKQMPCAQFEVEFCCGDYTDEPQGAPCRS